MAYISNVKYLGRTKRLSSLVGNDEYLYFSFVHSIRKNDPDSLKEYNKKIIFLRTPNEKGYFFEVKSFMGILYLNEVNINFIKNTLIPVVAEIAENGYLFGWSNPVCEEITKKLAVI
ncbi:MAG: hypothetical protein PHG82_01690 [Candidatus Gracilibacteria bacterium]|nr:hypothetical protein [Candidatus Gracilibacteria bacterium]